MQKYREEVLNYFRKKDPSIKNALEKKVSDWRFPFRAPYRFHQMYGNEVDILAFLSTAAVFNRYKTPIREKYSLKIPERGDKFIGKIIKEGTVNEKLTNFAVSVYIADQIVDRITRDREFGWFMSNRQYEDGVPYKSDYIFVDYPNMYKALEGYTGKNRSLIYIRDTIIGKSGSMGRCYERIVKYIEDNCNDNEYMFIYFVPCKKDYFSEWTLTIPIDCTPYIGQECGPGTNSKEVDDTVLLMLYDYCRQTYGVNISILSEDNYDFSLIAQDYSQPLPRAMFGNTNPTSIIGWDIITMENEGFSFDTVGFLTMFEDTIFDAPESETSDYSSSEYESEESSIFTSDDESYLVP